MSVTGKLNACNTKSDLALVLLRVAVINDILASSSSEFLDSQTIRDAQQPDAAAGLTS